MENFIFDFDGVLTDSVAIKTDAFCELFSEYDVSIVNKIKRYHLENGGVSRFEKIKYIYANFIKEELDQSLFKSKCDRFKKMVIRKVINSDEISGAYKLISAQIKGRKFIVTGTPQDEIEEILSEKKWSVFFDEVLGSPVKKDIHVKYLLEKYNVSPKDCLFFGDATTDYEAAEKNNVPFMGVCKTNSELLIKYPGINYVQDLNEYYTSFFKKE